MARISRRKALLGAGMVGLTTAGTSVVLGRGQEGWETPTARQVLEKIRLSDEQRKQYKILDSLDQIPVAPSNQPQGVIKTAKVEARVEAVKDGKGRQLAVALSWTCEVNVLNDLYVDGQPLQARTFSFSVQNISWQAGRGWPVYHVYCPRDEYGDMYYRNAKVHQIVPSIVDVTYFVGCSSSATCSGSRSGQIRFAVNDGAGDYGDNQGTFDVIIYSHS
jgi:hypothetical protein